MLFRLFHRATIVSLTLATAFFGVIACTSQPKAKDEPTWAENMQKLSLALSELLPLVASPQRFADPKVAPKIEAKTAELRSLAHALKVDPNGPSGDPTLKLVSSLFEEDLSRAMENLKDGNREYARLVLKDAVSYCIQCHTQTANGPSFPRLDLNFQLDGLSVMERAEFYTATRQFSLAITEFEKVISDADTAKTNSRLWEQALRSAMAIVVRVDKSPSRALEIYRLALANTGVPPLTQQSLKNWEKHLTEWSKERKTFLMKPPQILKFAESLIRRAQKNQRFPLDHSQDILYFRASSQLHDLLSMRSQSDDLTVQSLYLAGVATEAMRDMNFWTLHERYYETCVRQKPHSPLAKKCYDRINESVTVGYSGSGGTRVPPEEQRRLDELKALAE